MSLFKRLAVNVMKSSREKKIDHFYSCFREGETVLDLGVSRQLKWRLPITNWFLKTYRYDPETYTGLGIENLKGMENLYPGKRFVQYTGGVFPFPDNGFDWVFSNAVIEHVGDEKAQLLFINEMLRVGKSIFFTTPNKYFPVESHTLALFIHWHDALFKKWCLLKAAWITKEHLRLLSYRNLRVLMDTSDAASYSIHRNRFMGIPMTFTAIHQTT